MSSSYDAVHCAKYPSGDIADGMRMLFSTGRVIRTPKQRSTGTDSFANYTGYADIAALVCSARYSVFQSPVTLDRQGQAAVATTPGSNLPKSIPELHAWDLANAFFSSVAVDQQLIYSDAGSDAVKLGGDSEWASDTTTDDSNYNYFWQLLNIVSPQADVLDWSNTTLANKTLQSVWSTWSAQMAALHLKVPANHAVLGTTTTAQTRLLIHIGPFWTIEVGLIAMFLMAVALALLSPSDILPRDPGSLGGIATIVASSKDFQESLKGAWQYSGQGFRDFLLASQFSTSVHPPEARNRAPGFCINHRVQSSRKKASNLLGGKKRVWWKSRASSNAFVFVSPLLIVALIVLVETLYQLSKKNSGIVTVTEPTSLMHFAYTTVPAVIMVSMATVVGMLHFAVQILQPYRRLKCGPTPAGIGLFKCPFSGSSLSSVAEAFRDLDYAIILIVTSVFLSQYLTIVVSGLYTTHHFPTSRSMTIRQMDWFAHNTTLYNASPRQIESVTVDNLSFPRFTYEGLAFPTLKAPERTNGAMNVQVSALQGIMNCSVPTPGTVMPINNTFYHGEWKDIANIIVRNRDGCFKQWQTSEPLQYKNGSYKWPPKGFVEINRYMFISYQPPGTDEGEWSLADFSIPPTGYFGHIMGGGNRTGCPSSIGIVGKTAGHIIEQPTFFTCYPFERKVQANATFVLPDIDIDASAPPVVLSSSAEPFNVRFPRPPVHSEHISTSAFPLDAFQQFPLGSISDHEVFGPYGCPRLWHSRHPCSRAG